MRASSAQSNAVVVLGRAGALLIGTGVQGHEMALDLFGLVTGLSAGTTQISWDGPGVRIIEHQARMPRAMRRY